MNTIDKGSFSDPEVQRCPFDFIERLHDGPAVYKDPRTGFYVVSRYEDIATVSMNTDLFSNNTFVIHSERAPNDDGRAIAEHYRKRGGIIRMDTMVTADEPVHKRYRDLVDRVFTPSFVKRLEPSIGDLADELIDGFSERGSADLIDEFCIRLPMYVIVDQLGVDRHGWRLFKKWSDSTMALIDPNRPLDQKLALADDHIDMELFLLEQMHRFRKDPVDKMLSNLANAQVDGQYLDEVEFVSIAEQLFVAGNETTTSAIGHAARQLILNPDIRQRLIDEPQKVGAYAEEILRLHAPSPHLYRTVLKDTEIGGVPVPQGSLVMISYLAANRDERTYACPAQIDLERPGIRNHLAFGRGIHYCLGNLLARGEMRQAIARLLVRIPDMEFDPAYPEPGFAEVFHVHTLDQLHVRFTPSARIGAEPAEASAD